MMINGSLLLCIPRVSEAFFGRKFSKWSFGQIRPIYTFRPTAIKFSQNIVQLSLLCKFVLDSYNHSHCVTSVDGT